MTRDESLHPFDYGLDFFIDCKNMKSKKELDKLINKIYDDFENRTCESCKYCELINISDMGGTINNCFQTGFAIVEWRVFGCNEWEC